MYISSIYVRNFRCFKEFTADFPPGVCVIIGENNSGKSALLRALGMVFQGGGARRLEIFDFYQGIDDFTKPPSVSITATIRSSKTDSSSDLAIVAGWLTNIGTDWEAKLTYHFFLPEEEVDEFKARLGNNPSRDRFWRVTELSLPKYVARIDVGAQGVEQPGIADRANPQDLGRFGFIILDAIRDVESEMYSGRTRLLRNLLSSVHDKDVDKTLALEEEAGKLVEKLISRFSTNQLFGLVGKTGAQDGGAPGIVGRLRESDIIAALQLMISGHNVELPTSHNGLGYNNLIYISLMLASLDLSSEKNVGAENAIVFPLLLIEEPEAHLHPALQFKLLRYIRERIDNEKKSRQVFVTTHSTHITSAAGLDAIVLLSATKDGDIRAAYPGRVFPDSTDGEHSKKYVERYLDATKSTMLFARGVLLVEGITELLLVPTIAEHMGVSLADSHVALVAVDGRTFKHFIPLFGAGASYPEIAIDRPVACLIDADPQRKKQDGGQWSNCWPYQIGQDDKTYLYKSTSSIVDNLSAQKSGCHNIEVCTGAKTFEYDLALANCSNDYLITEACNQVDALKAYAEKGILDGLEDQLEAEVKSDLNSLTDTEKRKAATFATLFLTNVKSKGDHAFNLNLRLKQLLDSGSTIAVPSHIEKAIKWVCNGKNRTDNGAN